MREAVPPPADYDMEEGEIVDDEAPIVADAATTDKKAESDVESGEFKVVDGDDNPYTVCSELLIPVSLVLLSLFNRSEFPYLMMRNLKLGKKNILSTNL